MSYAPCRFPLREISFGLINLFLTSGKTTLEEIRTLRNWGPMWAKKLRNPIPFWSEVKMLSKTQKILLSVPTVLGLLFSVTYFFPSKFGWLIPDMRTYYIQVFTIQALTIIQLIVLIRRLWHYKSLTRSKKNEWTWLLILFSQITTLLFIWKKDEEFHLINDEQEANV